MKIQLNDDLQVYRAKWRKFISERSVASKPFYESLMPTAACWKVEDMDELDRRIAALRDMADHIHWAWVNERWLVTLHLRDSALEWGIKIVKLYLRRPGSSDALGLDHVDFYAPQIDENVLTADSIDWTHEENGEYCKWISIWFSGTEAKLRTDTTFAASISELQEINDHTTGGL